MPVQHRVLIVGGGLGIGACVTKRLANENTAKIVVLSLEVSPEVEELGKRGRIRVIRGDATDENVQRRTFEQVKSYLGGLDALILTLGVIGEIETVAKLDMAKFRKAYEINVLTPIEMTQSYLPMLRESRGRAIILSSKADSEVTYAGWSSYCSSKAALTRFINIIGHEEEGAVDVIGVYPGLTRTPMVSDLVAGKFEGKMKDFEVEFFQQQSHEDLIEPPEWTGNVVAKLASKSIETSGLTGKVQWYHDIDEDFKI